MIELFFDTCSTICMTAWSDGKLNRLIKANIAKRLCFNRVSQSTHMNNISQQEELSVGLNQRYIYSFNIILIKDSFEIGFSRCS